MGQIYAVDFDGTLCENKYPDIGKPNTVLIRFLKKRQKHGDILILWTCRCDEKLKEAVAWCKENGLEFDFINENAKFIIERFGHDCRKIYADYYIDDKAAVKRKLHVPYIPAADVVG